MIMIPILERTITVGNETIRPHIGTNVPSFGPVKERDPEVINRMVRIIKEAKEATRRYAEEKTTD
jgi:hypothetical protein